MKVRTATTPMRRRSRASRTVTKLTLKGTPHPTKLANKEFDIRAPKRGKLATPRMVITLPPDVIEYDIPCDSNQLKDLVLNSPDMIRRT